MIDMNEMKNDYYFSAARAMGKTFEEYVSSRVSWNFQETTGYEEEILQAYYDHKAVEWN